MTHSTPIRSSRLSALGPHPPREEVAALQELGAAFLEHPNSEALRAALRDGSLDDVGYYRQLLRLVYRLLFLLYVENRRLVLPSPSGEAAGPLPLALDHDADLWPGLLRAFHQLRTGGAGRSAPSSPGGLFGAEGCPHLEGANCEPGLLLRALRRLAGLVGSDLHHSASQPSLEVEQLGSIYESLLEYRPRVDPEGTPPFELMAGSGRRRTGSYYTPSELAGELIEHALVPVMEERLSRARTAAEGERALLGLRICDPSCGSGHFLLAAARRIAGELARVRSGEGEPTPESRQAALSEVIRSCLYAVDSDPLAVDICRSALWIEGRDANLSLDFLDHRVKRGDALVGVFDPAVLGERFPGEGHGGDGFRPCLSDGRGDRERLRVACDLWTASFFVPRRRNSVAAGPEWVGGGPWGSPEGAKPPLAGSGVSPGLSKTCDTLPGAGGGSPAEQAAALSREHAFFHWHLEFPEPFQAGGFDLVLGNPPYNATLSEGGRRLIKATLPAASSNTNTAVAFLQRARELLKPGGRSGLVVPRSLIFSGEWEGIRSRLFDEVMALIDAGEAFKGVKLEQVLLICGTEPASQVLAGPLPGGKHPQLLLEKEVWRSLGVWVTGLSDVERGVLRRVEGLPRLGELVRIYRGGGLQGSLDRQGELAVYGGAEVGVFELLRERGRTAEATLGRAAHRVLVPKVMAQNIVAHVKRPKPHAWIKAAIDRSGRAVPLDTINCIVPLGEDISLLEIAVLLNSRFASWYATRFVFADAQRTMHFDSEYAGRIPVPAFRGGRSGCTRFRLLELSAEGGGALDAERVNETIYDLLGLDWAERAEIDSYFERSP